MQDFKILYSEDDASVRRSVVRVLKYGLFQPGTANLVVDETKNGAEALRMTTQKRYDLLLSDIDMDEMDGLSLTESVRKNPELKDLKIILMSGNVFHSSGTPYKVRARMAGANLFLSKPVDSDTLIKAIHSLTGSGPAQGQAPHAGLILPPGLE